MQLRILKSGIEPSYQGYNAITGLLTSSNAAVMHDKTFIFLIENISIENISINLQNNNYLLERALF